MYSTICRHLKQLASSQGKLCTVQLSMYARLRNERLAKKAMKNEGYCNQHVYKQLCPWRSRREFAESLSDEIIYNKGGLVAINKPYGVRVAPLSNNLSPDKRALNKIATGNNDYTLYEALPQLTEALEYTSLDIMKSATRYESGVTLLSASPDITKKVQECVLKANPQKKFTTTYWVVVLGKLDPESNKERLGITMTTGKDGKDKQPTIITKFSNNSVKHGEVRPVYLEYKVLKYNSDLDVSLVEIRSSTTKWHFLRVYFAYKVAPILGDHLFGSRVKSVANVRITVNPFSDASKTVQSLNKTLLDNLALTKGQEVIIPSHIHLQEVIIPSYYQNDKNFIIKAKPPPSFAWTCIRLGLLQNTEGVVAHEEMLS